MNAKNFKDKKPDGKKSDDLLFVAKKLGENTLPKNFLENKSDRKNIIRKLGKILNGPKYPAKNLTAGSLLEKSQKLRVLKKPDIKI